MQEVFAASPFYIRNPDVVLREEEPDGGLLFNPDTDQIRVLNTTGLFIWKLCDGSQSVTAILDAIRTSFDAVPEDQLAAQVTGFIEEMTTAGFLGVVED